MVGVRGEAMRCQEKNMVYRIHSEFDLVVSLAGFINSKISHSCRSLNEV